MNWTFVIGTVISVVASQIWEVALEDTALGQILIFDFIPYLCIVGVLFFSIIKIRIILHNDERFTIKSRLQCIPILVCFIYIGNCVHYSFDGGADFTEATLENHILAITLFLLHQFTLMLVVLAMFRFTNLQYT